MTRINKNQEAIKYYNIGKKEYENKNYHLVVSNLSYALSLCANSNSLDNEIVGEIYYLLCKTYIILKHYDRALEMSEKGYFYYLGRNRYKVFFFSNQKIIIYMRQYKYDKAIKWGLTFLNKFIDRLSIDEIKIKESIIYNLATCYLNIGDLIKAKEKYIEVCRYLKQVENNSLKGKVLVGLGYIYHLKGNVGYAEKCYIMAKKYVSKVDDPVTYGRILHNLGEIYIKTDNIKMARRSFLESVRDENLYKLDKNRVAASLRGIATTYLSDDLRKVKKYTLRALDLMLENSGSKFSPTEEQELGMIFLILAYWLKLQKHSDYELYLNTAEKIFKKYNLQTELKQVEQIRSNLIIGGELYV